MGQQYDVNDQPIVASKKVQYDANDQPIGQQVAVAPQTAPAQPPSSFTDKLKQAISFMAHEPPPGTDNKSFISDINPKGFTALLPMLGALAAPETGGSSLLLSALGAGSGSLIKQGINEKIDKTNPSLGESALETGEDIVGQTVLPKMLGGILQPRTTIANILANKGVQKVFPQIKNATTGVTAKALQFPETGILESAAHNTDDIAKDFVSKYNAASDVKSQNAIWRQYMNQIGSNNVGKSLLNLNRDVSSGGSVANQQSYKAITNRALSDVSTVRNFKLATGEDLTIRQLAQNDVLTGAFKSKGEFDPEVVLGKLNGDKSEVYKEAMGHAYDSLKELAEATPDAKQGHVISYFKRHLMWSGAMMAGGETLGAGHLASLAPVGGYILADAAVSRVMSNPTIAKLVVKAMKTPLTAPEAPLLQKVLVNVLRGTDAYLQKKDSDSIDGKPTIDKVTIDPSGPQLAR